MQLPVRIAQGVRDGSISLAYRRWEQPRVRTGHTQLTSAGIVRFEAVDEITDLTSIPDSDARAAGFDDAGALLRMLAAPINRGPRGGRGGERVFRVKLAWVGEDPRIQLRSAVPDAAGLAAVSAAVTRLDAGRRTGPWTRPILEWIRDHPGVISTELAALLGRELAPMKADIRRLKALGLTESLRVGYRLSPRGIAYLESLG